MTPQTWTAPVRENEHSVKTGFNNGESWMRFERICGQRGSGAIDLNAGQDFKTPQTWTAPVRENKHSAQTGFNKGGGLNTVWTRLVQTHVALGPLQVKSIWELKAPRTLVPFPSSIN